MPTPQILLVEDDPAINATLAFALAREGWRTESLALGQAALLRLDQGGIDLVVLDVGLPDLSGFEVCRQLRQRHTLPVIFLTAHSDEVDRILGLEIGGDDYLTKPFSPRELIARVRVQLRRRAERAPPQTPPSPPPPRLSIDRARADARFCEAALKLTRYEFLLLAYLADHPRRVFTREQLLHAVWAYPEHCTERTVDTHIKTLRAKLRAVNPEADPLQTHRGMGYALDPNA